MTIRISNTSIHFGNFTLTANTEGFSFDGKIRAKRGFVDSRPRNAMGASFGYMSGGDDPAAGFSDRITKFSFTTDTDAIDVGNLVGGRYAPAGSSSDINGYASGGLDPTPPSTRVTEINRFPFATDTNASDVGDLTAGRQDLAGASSDTNGYALLGYDVPSSPSNVIDRFPFAVETTSTDVGDGTVSASNPGSSSSKDNGYHIGGNTPTDTNVIAKFPFASDTNATDVGDLNESMGNPTDNLNSLTHGYAAGGAPPGSPSNNTIQKFPFATDTNTTDVGDLTQARYGACGSSSKEFGHVSGGGGTPTTTDTIDKFTFASDANATDVGNLPVNQFNGGSQVV